jgi:hypothetical protein
VGQRCSGDTASVTGKRLARLEGVELTDIKEVEKEGEKEVGAVRQPWERPGARQGLNVPLRRDGSKQQKSTVVTSQ